MEWLAPAFGFVVVEGALGITAKLALRDLHWSGLLLWTAGVYLVVASTMIVIGEAGIGLGPSTGWAALSGLCAAAGLLAFCLALERGEASRVVPITAGYPVVSVVLAAVFLSEGINVARVAGTLLVVAGVVVLSRD